MLARNTGPRVSRASQSQQAFLLNELRQTPDPTRCGSIIPITRTTAESIRGTVNADITIAFSLGSHLVGQYVLIRIFDDAKRTRVGGASVTALGSGENTERLHRTVTVPGMGLAPNGFLGIL